MTFCRTFWIFVLWNLIDSAKILHLPWLLKFEMACLLALLWAQTTSFSCFLIYTDSELLVRFLIYTDLELLVRLLDSSTTRDISIHHTLSDIQRLASTLRWCKIVKVNCQVVARSRSCEGVREFQLSFYLPLISLFFSCCFIYCKFSTLKRNNSRWQYAVVERFSAIMYTTTRQMKLMLMVVRNIREVELIFLGTSAKGIST